MTSNQVSVVVIAAAIIGGAVFVAVSEVRLHRRLAGVHGPLLRPRPLRPMPPRHPDRFLSVPLSDSEYAASEEIAAWLLVAPADAGLAILDPRDEGGTP